MRLNLSKRQSEAISRNAWWFKCGSCLSSVGFGTKRLAKRYRLGLQVIRNQFAFHGGKRGPKAKIHAGFPAKRWRDKANEAIMDHYQQEALATARHDCFMTPGMVRYWMNHERRKEQGRATAKRIYHTRIKLCPELKEKRRKAHASWKQNNKAAVVRWAKKWRENNKEKLRSYSKKRSRPKDRVVENLRKRLRQYLKGVDIGGCLGLIGCTRKRLIRHIESRLEQGMDWANYGSVWHIDHIVPCAMFNLSDPCAAKKCFHYSNLRPLFAAKNMEKGALLYDTDGWLKLEVNKRNLLTLK